VVIAVAPDVAGRIFNPLAKATSKIPTTIVQSIVQGDGMRQETQNVKTTSTETQVAQSLRFRTSLAMGQTESIHIHRSGAMVTTCPFSSDISELQDVLKSVKFLRALRTPHSRRVVNDIFGENSMDVIADQKEACWRNGDDKVWLVGGWCWDGMVLLEGCVVSAMRVATALDVHIPWQAGDL